MKVATVYAWQNGMLTVFGCDGEQMPDLQGRDTPERRNAIRARSDERTVWHNDQDWANYRQPSATT